jgi:nucleotide-binding universal stress UspA family protein
MKIIVSYDGTDNDRDAVVLAGLLAAPADSIELAYVRHAAAPEGGVEAAALLDAGILDTGVELLGRGDVPRHVLLSGSTADGLRGLAVAEGADLVVFGSEYRTSPGHVHPQATASRLLEGGPVAVAIAPAAFANAAGYRFRTIGPIDEDGDTSARETADALAMRLGSMILPGADSGVDLLVVGSKAGIDAGRVTISAAAEYVIELARCPTVIVARSTPLGSG